MRKGFVRSAMVLLLLVGSLLLVLSGCSTTQQASMQSVIVEDGSLYHPYRVDAPPAVPSDVWQVETVQGTQSWVLSWMYGLRGMVALKAGQYILHGADEYQLSGIDQTHHRLSAVILGN